MPRPSQPAAGTESRLRVARRAGALVLLALLLLPWYRLVGLRADGPAVAQTLRLGGPYLLALWGGAGLGVVGALLLGWLLPPGPAEALGGRLARALLAPPAGWFAAGTGVASAAISTWVAVGVLDRKPILLDGLSQLVQSRYLAAGRLAGPRLEDPAFWQFQFMVASDAGWTSQYPPGFAGLLALAGAALPLWLIGPLVLGCAVALSSLLAERLFDEDRLVARLGAALTALSPFLGFHAAAYMSHVLALALAVGGALAASRAARGSVTGSLVAGAAAGALFATRPYTAVLLGPLATLAVWRAAASAPTRAAWLRHLTGVAAGAIPFVAATLLYNRRLFGAFARFGYVAAEGPGHELGFHLDPWGDPYGPAEAVGYTSADLQGLSLDLLQTPIPAVVVVAGYLLLAPRLSRGAAVAAAWALLPVAGHALYWHHDLFMGPRLLYESAPAWCWLVAAAMVGAVRRAPHSPRSPWAFRRAGLAGAFALSLLVALLYAGPAKLESYRDVSARSGMRVAAPPVERPSLVFVHGSWEDRLAARLAATMRVDSVRLALRRNSTCRLELHLQGLERAGGDQAPTGLAFRRAEAKPLRELAMPSGSVVRAEEGETLHPLCAREAESDFRGVVALPPLLWQGDLPGLGSEGALFVRDLGPERNRRLLERFPEREPGVLLARGVDLRLAPYEEGMTELWGTVAAP